MCGCVAESRYITGPALAEAVALECVAAPVIVICAALLGAYYLGANAGLTGVSAQAAGLYGTAIATMVMLSTAAYML